MKETSMSDAPPRPLRLRLPIRAPSGLVVLLALLGLLALLPLVGGPYLVQLMIPCFGYGIALLGFNLLFGTTGLLSFGHALFIGIGAYAVAVMTSKLGVMSFELILLVAALAAVIMSVLIGLVCVRHTKIFFGMLTLAFGMLFHSFLFKFYDLTGGDQGMKILRPRLLGMDFSGTKTEFLSGPFYYYTLVLFALIAIVMWRVVQSPFGLHLRAIRENAGKAAYVGVSVFRMRLAAFVISGVTGALGGAILGVVVGLADPEIAFWTQSGNLVFMTVLGGSGTFVGPVVGSLVFVLLQDWVMSVSEYWRFVMGTILILLVVFLPQGLCAALAALFVRKPGGR
jgi:branched-chain amino acid transport system permease protein